MENEPRWYQRVLNFIRARVYTILYVVLLLILTWYVVKNWEICISMQFFSQFNGNNILFLVWIACILLLFYDVEAKGWKFHLKGNKDMQRQFACAESSYIQNQMSNIRERDNMQPQTPDKMEVATRDE